MYPILYENITSGSIPTSYGVGVLKDAISCEVKEERNGEYELTLKYPSSGAYASYLLPRAVLKVKPNFTDDPQLFRIYKVGKSIGSSFTVNARHISYDLSGFPITSGTASNVGDALQLLQNASTGYTFTTDKSLNANFKISAPSSVRSWLGGKQGSILDLYGPGDYKYNNFNVQFLANRGQDRGVTVRFGKNLTKLDTTNDSSNVVTGVMAYWQSADDTPTTVCSNVIPTGVTLDVGVVSVIDASEKYETEPTVAQLDAYVNSYISDHQVTQVKKNIKLDFLQIATLKDRVDLCDTVHVIYEDYGINVTAKCISTIWDVLNEKYIEIELGEPKTNIADTISNISRAVSDVMTANQVQQAINDATELITGNKGGYVILHDSDQDGFPDELLIMNTSDISTATKVWRWNLSGLGYSNTGYAGSFGLAMTMDGAIVADYIKTGNLVFGGSGNTNGKLEIRDANGNLICRFDKTGAEVKGDIIAESFQGDLVFGGTGDNANGKLDIKDSSGNIICHFDKNGATVNGNINAYSFTADAGNSINVETLTQDYVISPLGTKSGLFIKPNGSTLPVAGIGTSPDNANTQACVFAADGTNLSTYPKVAMMRSWHPTSGGTKHVGFESFYTTYRTGTSEQNSANTYLRGGEIYHEVAQGQYDVTMCSELGLSCTNTYASNRGVYARAEGESSSSSTNGRAMLTVQYGNSKFIQLYNTKSNQYISMHNNDGNSQNFTMNDNLDSKSISMHNSTNYQYISMVSGGSSSIYLNGNNGNITCVSLTQTSSKKYKKKIKTLTDEEAKKILELRPVTYDFKDEAKGVNMRGFIAEEVDEVIPELVKHTKDYPVVTTIIDEDGNEVVQEQTKDEVSLDYTAMIPYLTKMVQLQQKQLDAQQAEIDELKNEIKKLKGDA